MSLNEIVEAFICCDKKIWLTKVLKNVTEKPNRITFLNVKPEPIFNVDAILRLH